MNRRVNVVLADATITVLDRVAPRGKRSSFISAAVLHHVSTRRRESLRERLKQEALANVQADLEMSQEWFPLEEEAWQIAEGRRQKRQQK